MEEAADPSEPPEVRASCGGLRFGIEPVELGVALKEREIGVRVLDREMGALR